MGTGENKWVLPAWVFPSLAILLAVVIAGIAWWMTRRNNAPVTLTTPYQAILLSNGQVYYGRLEGYGSRPFPVLREVYYIKSGTDAKTSQPTSILVTRGNEWHGPDHMILNASHIIQVEPVTPDSKVAELIAALKMQR